MRQLLGAAACFALLLVINCGVGNTGAGGFTSPASTTLDMNDQTIQLSTGETIAASSDEVRITAGGSANRLRVGASTITANANLSMNGQIDQIGGAGDWFRPADYGGVPTGTDCDAGAEEGRMARNGGDLYICDQTGATTGWQLVYDGST